MDDGGQVRVSVCCCWVYTCVSRCFANAVINHGGAITAPLQNAKHKTHKKTTQKATQKTTQNTQKNKKKTKGTTQSLSSTTTRRASPGGLRRTRHAFGLEHKGQKDAAGAVINELYGGPDDGTWAPLMGWVRGVFFVFMHAHALSVRPPTKPLLTPLPPLLSTSFLPPPKNSLQPTDKPLALFVNTNSTTPPYPLPTSKQNELTIISQNVPILPAPTNIAAAQAMPELFTADAADEARSPETAFAARLLADRARVGMRWCA